MGLGESSTLLLTLNEKIVAIIDDERARKVGKLLIATIHGTLFVLKLMLLLNIINSEEIKTSIRIMVNKGFRISPEVLLEFIGDIEQEESKA